ncbi:MAG TPA: peptidoglycan recognition family protein [Candidatus Limnocylindria bacterium]|nr:peptidoglycan recognition family protein [Candidatus Limnocylindria bacterium]
MRGWVSLLVVAVTVLAAVSVVASAVRMRPATAATGAASGLNIAAAPTDAPRAAPPARAAAAMPFPYEPQREWLMKPTTNHWPGRRGVALQYVVIHYTVITYEQTLRAFNIPKSDVSAHYVVRGDGHIAQVVGEADTAWHAGNYLFNLNSIGIELELNTRTNPFFREEQYRAAAAITCSAAARWGFPLDRAHVIGHNEVPGATHTDPGPTWNWPHFMWLLSLCAPPNASTVRAEFVSQTPYPQIAAHEVGAVEIVLRNTGGTAWRKGTPQEARLAVAGNDGKFAFLAAGWHAPDRPAVQLEDVVPPGGTATFGFAVKGALPGTYRLPLRGVIDGGAWMDDLGLFTEITVR